MKGAFKLQVKLQEMGDTRRPSLHGHIHVHIFLQLETWSTVPTPAASQSRDAPETENSVPHNHQTVSSWMFTERRRFTMLMKGRLTTTGEVTWCFGCKLTILPARGHQVQTYT